MNKNEKRNILMENLGNEAWRAISANKFKFIDIISNENINELIKCKNIFIETKTKVSNIDCMEILWDQGGYRKGNTGIKAFNKIKKLLEEDK